MVSDLVSLQKDNKKSRIKDFLSKSNKIHIKLRIWPHLLEKSLIIKNFIFIQGLQGYFGKCFIKLFTVMVKFCELMRLYDSFRFLS